MRGVFLDVLLFLAYIGSSAFGLYRMKQAAEVVSPAFALGFVFYGAGFLWWIVILRRLDLSLAFPIAAGGLIVATQVVGYFLLDESMTRLQLAGVGAILLGITVLFMRAA